MKKLKQRTNKLPFIALAVLLVLAITGGAAYYAFYRNSTPQQDSDVVENTPATDEPIDAEDPEAAPPESPTEQGDTPSNPTPNRPYVSSPSRSPAINEPYPVETEHYRIEQNASSRFTITLFPLANTSDPSGYDTELRDYKNAATDYLAERYGSMQNLNITWIPDRANHL